VSAGPVPSARSRLVRRGRQRRCLPVAAPTSIASTTPLIRRRQRLSLRRRRRAAGVVDDHSASGMLCVSNERQPLSGTSTAAAPLPVLSSPRHEDGQAACADARNGRRPSPSSTGPTVAALPPQARIAASRPDRSRSGALVTRQRPPQKGVSKACVPAGPVPSTRSRFGGRGRWRRCRPATAADPTAAAPLMTTRRHCCRC